MKDLIIIGASGHGKVVADIALRLVQYQYIRFLDDDGAIKECMGFPVVGTIGQAERYISGSDIFVAVGNARARQKITERLTGLGAEVPILVHPAASVGFGVEMGCGTVVMAGTVINTGSRIGSGCIINTCSSIDHDCRIGDYVHVSVGAHLAGGVTVGAEAWIGAGATISNNVSIVRECVIGAGAVVISDIKEEGTYIGVPARKSNKDKKGRMAAGRPAKPIKFIKK